ncbi:MAG: thioredoxin family protein, partial [Eudoraea sp.]|uniref:thioredoxin family protein n=1 Tax=Eudoraea sp. TaxID=1979955 RepID=UPI003C7365C1
MINTKEYKLSEKIITSSLAAALSYKEYRILVDELAKHGKTTGTEQKESLIEYTRLNSRRMKRWDKTIKLPESAFEVLKNFDKPVLWIVLTESWCGDAAPSIPVMNKIAESSAKITFKVV